jgi:hypothetical protein
MILIIMLLVPGVIFGTVWANWFECAYGECPESNSSSSVAGIQSVGHIGTLVIIGAGHFLKSHSDFQLFLNKYELSELHGICFEELQLILNNCIYSMESTKFTYYDLKTIAALTPYDQSVIENLKEFDYDGFLQGLNLNPAVFQKVRGFLSHGDVNGSINAIYLKTLKLLPMLYSIKIDIDKNTLPEISKLWELNQEYSNALLFGQYIAWIFKSIL